jgi:hypothetical protein
VPSSPRDDGFTETKTMPVGRKARSVPDVIWRKLAESASRSVAFTKSGPPDVIDNLRKDLSAAAVRAKYEVTVGTERVSDTVHKLTFAARAKAVPEPATEQAEQAEQADADADAPLVEPEADKVAS